MGSTESKESMPQCGLLSSEDIQISESTDQYQKNASEASHAIYEGESSLRSAGFEIMYYHSASNNIHHLQEWCLASKDGAVYLCFRGSTTTMDFLCDSSYIPKKEGNFYVSSGVNTSISNAFDELVEQSVEACESIPMDILGHSFGGALSACLCEQRVIAAVQNVPLIICGHSLGGSLATCFWYHLHLESNSNSRTRKLIKETCAVITFGAPSIFCEEKPFSSSDRQNFERLGDKVINFVNELDLVPQLLSDQELNNIKISVKNQVQKSIHIFVIDAVLAEKISSALDNMDVAQRNQFVPLGKTVIIRNSFRREKVYQGLNVGVDWVDGVDRCFEFQAIEAGSLQRPFTYQGDMKYFHWHAISFHDMKFYRDAVFHGCYAGVVFRGAKASAFENLSLGGIYWKEIDGEWNHYPLQEAHLKSY